MKKLIVFLITSFIFINLSAQNNSLEWIRGNWKGTGFQTNNNSTWNIILDFEYPDNILEIRYPSLNCGGNWKLLSNEGSKAEFVEIITDGKTNCIDGSKIVITYIDEEHIQVSWFSKYIKGVDAYAALSRTKPVWLNGMWTGKGFQPNMKDVWSVKFTYNEKGNSAIIKYPSLGCEGEWEMIENRGNQVVFIEKINIGKSKCVDGSKIIVSKIDNNYINVTWVSSQISGVDAYATLTKDTGIK